MIPLPAFQSHLPRMVADSCIARVDMRVKTPAEADRITEIMPSLQPVIPGASVEVTGGLSRPPMPRDELMVQMARLERVPDPRAFAPGRIILFSPVCSQGLLP